MITQSGMLIEPDNPRCPTIEDLGIHLSRLVRYGGAIDWSVLSHSLLVAAIVDEGEECTDETWAWALLHDAHEAVTGEVVYGYKGDGTKSKQRDLDTKIAAYMGIDRSRANMLAIGWADRASFRAETTVLGTPEFIRKFSKWGDPDQYPEHAEKSWTDLVSLLSERATCYENPDIYVFIDILREIRDNGSKAGRTLFRDKLEDMK